MVVNKRMLNLLGFGDLLCVNKRSSEKLPGAEEAGDGGGVLAGDAEREQLHPLLEFALVQLLHSRSLSLAGKQVPRVLAAGERRRASLDVLPRSESRTQLLSQGEKLLGWLNVRPCKSPKRVNEHERPNRKKIEKVVCTNVPSF